MDGGHPRSIDQALKKTGVFFGSIFMLGSVYSAVLCITIQKLTLAATLLSPSFLLTFIVAMLFFMTVVWTTVKWIQPLIFLAISPYSISTDTTSFFGLGFFVIGVALLFRMGFFEKRRILRLILCFAVFVISEFAATFNPNNRVTDALCSVFFMIAFLVFLYLAFQEKLAVYLKEPKRELSLKDKGLATTERAYTLAFASGRTTKEIAFDFGVSESTVRNTLARSYKKLGVEDKAGLSALAERYRLID